MIARDLGDLLRFSSVDWWFSLARIKAKGKQTYRGDNRSDKITFKGQRFQKKITFNNFIFFEISHLRGRGVLITVPPLSVTHATKVLTVFLALP